MRRMNMWITSARSCARARWCLPGRTMKQIRSIRFHSRRLRTWKGETDARGRKLVIHTSFRFPIIRSALQRRNWQVIRLPRGEEAGGGERLAASYVNFIFPTRAVILPAFGGRMRRATGAQPHCLRSGIRAEDYPGAGACNFSRRREYPLYYTADPGGKK